MPVNRRGFVGWIAKVAELATAQKTKISVMEYTKIQKPFGIVDSFLRVNTNSRVNSALEESHFYTPATSVVRSKFAKVLRMRCCALK